MSEGERIQELIGHWVAYAEKRPDPSIEGFSSWLKNQFNSQERESELSLKEKKMQLGRLFGRIINFVELWGKLSFKDLPIKQFEDFGILMEVKYRENPSKNEVASLLLNEKSTAFEIIKRLIREGLLAEEVDKEDKRIRRIRLTQPGKKVLREAEMQAGKVSEILMGDSTEDEIDAMITKLEELDRFHTNLYEHVDYETIDDLLK